MYSFRRPFWGTFGFFLRYLLLLLSDFTILIFFLSWSDDSLFLLYRSQQLAVGSKIYSTTGSIFQVEQPVRLHPMHWQASINSSFLFAHLFPFHRVQPVDTQFPLVFLFSFSFSFLFLFFLPIPFSALKCYLYGGSTPTPEKLVILLRCLTAWSQEISCTSCSSLQTLWCEEKTMMNSPYCCWNALIVVSSTSFMSLLTNVGSSPKKSATTKTSSKLW